MISVKSFFSPLRLSISQLLIFLSVFLLWGDFLSREVSGERTLFVLDTSLSMAVEDIGDGSGEFHSRLEKAKEIIESSLSILPGEYALITYARRASLVIPFSSEREHFLSVLDTVSPVEYFGGSDLGEALRLKSFLYGGENIRVVILTDGGSTTREWPALETDGVLYGIGTEIGGKIPLGYNALGERRYKYGTGGELIISYDASMIESIANRYDWSIVHIDRDDDISLVSSTLPQRGESLTIWSYIALLFFLIGFFLPLYAHTK